MIDAGTRLQAKRMQERLKTSLKATTRATFKNTEIAVEASLILDALTLLANLYGSVLVDRAEVLAKIENETVKAEVGLLWDVCEDYMFNGEITINPDREAVDSVARSTYNSELALKFEARMAALGAASTYMEDLAWRLKYNLDLAYAYQTDTGAVTADLQVDSEAVKVAVSGALTLLTRAKEEGNPALAATAVQQAKAGVEVAFTNMDMPSRDAYTSETLEISAKLLATIGDVSVLLQADWWREKAKQVLGSDEPLVKYMEEYGEDKPLSKDSLAVKAMIEANMSDWWASFAIDVMKNGNDVTPEKDSGTVVKSGVSIGLKIKDLEAEIALVTEQMKTPGTDKRSLQFKLKGLEDQLAFLLEAKKTGDTSTVTGSLEVKALSAEIASLQISISTLTNKLGEEGVDEAAVEAQISAIQSKVDSLQLKLDAAYAYAQQTAEGKDNEQTEALQEQMEALAEIKAKLTVSIEVSGAAGEYSNSVVKNLSEALAIIEKMDKIVAEMEAEDLPQKGEPVPAQPVAAVDNLLSTVAASFKDHAPEASALLSGLVKKSNTATLNKMESSTMAAGGAVASAWKNLTDLYKHTNKEKPKSEDRVDAEGNPMPGPRSDEWKAKSLQLAKDTAESSIKAAKEVSAAVDVYKAAYDAIYAIKDKDERALAIVLPTVKFLTEKLVDKFVPEEEKKEAEQTADLLSCIAALMGVTLKATDQFVSFVELLGGKK